ncbi:MAG: GMC family oxidoreductase [Desulfoferrobacter sp.]
MDALKNTSFDAIIIGSGPGGAAVTHELSKRGKRVLVLEKGSGDKIKGTFLQGASIAMIPGRSFLVTQQFLALVRGIAYGGSSVLYYACAFDPPYEMFESYGIDLRPEVEQVKKDLPIAPLSDDLLGPAARRIMESAQALGHAWHKLPKIVYQEKCRPNCDKCTIGCPCGAKWTSRMYIDEALGRGSLLLTGAHVERVVAHAGYAAAVRFTRAGKTHQVAAPVIVLAAGGIGTPLILRNSGIAGAGYDFFFDPLIVAMGEVDDINCGSEIPMAAGYRDEEEGYIMTDLVWPRWIFSLFSAEVLRFDRLASHGRTLPIMIKGKDGLGGHLTARGGIRKRLDEKDRRKLLRGYERAKGILQNAGARHIFKTWFMATHPGGTAKIGDLLDHNLQTELNGLYVCDCSVIPESWGLPPTLTLIALGKRLGKYLATESGLLH